jgi:methylmalonyl-CoA mutase
VLMEEAHLGRVADPAAGSGYVDALTDQLAAEAWARFQTTEAGGGIVEALRSARIAAEVAGARAALEASVREGRRKILGVTDFESADGGPVEFEPVTGLPTAEPTRLPGADGACPPLVSWRLEEAAQ